MRRIVLITAILALGLGQLLNPGNVTTPTADTDIPTSDQLGTLGPITLIAD